MSKNSMTVQIQVLHAYQAYLRKTKSYQNLIITIIRSHTVILAVLVYTGVCASVYKLNSVGSSQYICKII